MKDLKSKSARRSELNAVKEAVFEARKKDEEKKLKEREVAVAAGDFERVRELVDGGRGRGRGRSNLPSWMDNK